MRKWKLPRVFEIASAGQYFMEMAELNKSSRSFSHRELSKYLKWPVSYIPDLIKGRKTFTTARAIELIKAFQINPLDAEHLIFISIASQSKKDISEINELRQIKSPKLRKETFSAVTVFDFPALLTLQSIARLGPDAKIEKIKKLLITRGLDEWQVEDCLKILCNERLVTRKLNVYNTAIERAYSDINFQSKEMLNLQKSFLESAKIFFDDVHRPASGGSAFVVINRKRVDEVREKIQSLRNWMLEISSHDSKAAVDDTLLFQFDIHLHPVFREELLNGIRAES